MKTNHGLGFKKTYRPDFLHLRVERGRKEGTPSIAIASYKALDTFFCRNVNLNRGHRIRGLSVYRMGSPHKTSYRKLRRHNICITTDDATAISIEKFLARESLQCHLLGWSPVK